MIDPWQETCVERDSVIELVIDDKFFGVDESPQQVACAATRIGGLFVVAVSSCQFDIGRVAAESSQIGLLDDRGQIEIRRRQDWCSSSVILVLPVPL
jgi:hypothetical protein